MKTGRSMKLKYVLAICSLSSIVGQKSFALSAKQACPQILEASGVNLGISKEILYDQFKHWNEDGTFDFEQKSELTTYFIKSGKDTSNYKISVEEIKSAGSVGTKKLEIDCPVVKSWEATSLPVVQVTKPSAVLDNVDKEFPGAVASITRDGLEIIKLFPGKEKFFTLTLYWRVLTNESQTLWPKLITDSKTTYLKNEIAENERLPVKGVRISTTENFGNIWYLLTREINEGLAANNDEFPEYAGPPARLMTQYSLFDEEPSTPAAPKIARTDAGSRR